MDNIGVPCGRIGTCTNAHHHLLFHLAQGSTSHCSGMKASAHLSVLPTRCKWSESSKSCDVCNEHHRPEHDKPVVTWQSDAAEHVQLLQLLLVSHWQSPHKCSVSRARCAWLLCLRLSQHFWNRSPGFWLVLQPQDNGGGVTVPHPQQTHQVPHRSLLIH